MTGEMVNYANGRIIASIVSRTTVRDTMAALIYEWHTASNVFLIIAAVRHLGDRECRRQWLLGVFAELGAVLLQCLHHRMGQPIDGFDRILFAQKRQAAPPVPPDRNREQTRPSCRRPSCSKLAPLP